MKKVLDFLKSNFSIIKWTVEYFAFLSLILWLLFNFNVFSSRHWWIFSHATLHGFGGLVFGTLMYSAIPIYIATVLIMYRKKEPIFTIPIPEKIKNVFGKIKTWFAKPAPEPAPAEQQNEPEQNTAPEYPSDMPREMYIPYIRAKQHIPLTTTPSTFNKTPATPVPEPVIQKDENESFPIPSDFDISDSLPDVNSNPFGFGDGVPVFKDIDFDTPTITEPKTELSNATTEYCKNNNIEFETYHEFVATEKYLIYEHNDGDFWVMDDETWFASKKQRPSPIPEMINLAQQNDLIPVLYLESQNIMDLPGTIEKLESNGVRVIKSLDELK